MLTQYSVNKVTWWNLEFLERWANSCACQWAIVRKQDLGLMALIEVYLADQEWKGVFGAVRRGVLTVGCAKNCYR
jgi:hypothetical protein